ncbi:GNAT family N-acetyltransferase [Coraliomargarita akajimensis]|uniref:GCN5-related N-acetyltransferase n=1 Tax=Coraliomargarita akajimensis (strain DSM 45221 / IAM 15411 / JCM 23193 / KCTC 12865 / 04OKA010-24) TaxID=583355 RepID=D5EN86_CORAD|nr:GNAT family N-acetyltransferase [Coraliomargarita akajimensis]ADE53521.1 GCN5-related N-acetyltransferase [Coraliomargarita akajimensis DSM 45221]
MKLRLISGSDFSRILPLEQASYDTPEDESILKAKWQNAPEYGFVTESGGRLAGFVIAYPAKTDYFARLHSSDDNLGALDQRRSLYIHDMAVSADYSGQGIASTMLNRLFAVAREQGLAHSHLVAVTGLAADFWSKRGYEITPHKLTAFGYSADAVAMQRTL